jgi:hypothetical protein
MLATVELDHNTINVRRKISRFVATITPSGATTVA